MSDSFKKQKTSLKSKIEGLTKRLTISKKVDLDEDEANMILYQEKNRLAASFAQENEFNEGGSSSGESY